MRLKKAGNMSAGHCCRRNNAANAPSSPELSFAIPVWRGHLSGKPHFAAIADFHIATFGGKHHETID
jgi:hypothetical protein